MFPGLEGDLKGHIIQGAACYKVYGGEGSRVDAFAGVRYYNLDLWIDLRPGLLTGWVSQRGLRGGWLESGPFP